MSHWPSYAQATYTWAFIENSNCDSTWWASRSWLDYSQPWPGEDRTAAFEIPSYGWASERPLSGQGQPMDSITSPERGNIPRQCPWVCQNCQRRLCEISKGHATQAHWCSECFAWASLLDTLEGPALPLPQPPMLLSRVRCFYRCPDHHRRCQLYDKP